MSFIILSLISSTVYAQEAPFPGTIESRRDWAINDLASRPNYNDITPSTLGICVAKILKGVDVEWALEAINHRLERAGDDALQMHQDMHTYLLTGEDYYTSDMIENVKSRFSDIDYDDPNFCSDNFVYSHWATGYMVGEHLPDVKDEHGRKGDELADAMRDKLYGRFDDIVNRGFGEFGSVNYAHHTYDALRMLAEHAKDPDMRNRSKMILDWLWVNWALDWHNGYFVTPSSRDKRIAHMHANPSSLHHHALASWVYMGAHRQVEDFGGASGDHRDGYNYWAIYEGDYSPPQIALDIGKTSQNVAYESRKRSYYDMCHNEMRINRTAFFEPNWGLASMNFRNIDEKTWHREGHHIALKWDSPHDANMFWVTIDNDHIRYLTGDEHRSHRIMQHKGTAVGTFLSQNENNELLAAFSKSGAIVKKVEEDGWLFCHTGVSLFAFKTIKSYSWADDHDKYNVLGSTHDKNGWILETADLSRYAGDDVDTELDAFIKDVLANASIDVSHIDEDNPRLIYRSIHGYTLDNTWYDLNIEENKYFQVNGKPIDYESYKQIESPWASQEINSGIMTLNHEEKTVVYDFNDWTVSGNNFHDRDEAPVDSGAIEEDTQPVKLILDSDFGGDCDDAAALAVAHYLMNTGEAKIIGVMTSTRGHPIVPAIDVVNPYYGRPGIPIEHIGAARDDGPIGLNRQSQWTGPLKDHFPHEKTNDSVPHSTRLYRDLLYHSSEPVNIAVHGNQKAISAFLNSEANYEGDGIPYTGRELAEQKVDKLVLMAGDFKNPDRAEWNVIQDPPSLYAAQNIAKNWPGEIIYTGWEIGLNILSGGTLTNPEVNPVAMAHKESSRTFPRPGRGKIGDNNSWDQVAIFQAVRGNQHAGERFWELSDYGTVTINDQGNTLHKPHKGGKHRIQIQDKNPYDRVYLFKKMGLIFDEMMTAPPDLESGDPTHYKISLSGVPPHGGTSVIAGSEITVTAWLMDADGNHVLEPGHEVNWKATNGGILSSSQSLTNDFGRATVTLTVSSKVGVEHVVTATDEPDNSMVGDSPVISTSREGQVLVKNTSDVVDDKQTAEVQDENLDGIGDELRKQSDQHIATGIYNDSGDQRSAVVVFQLPNLPSGTSVKAADFGVYLSGKNNTDTLFNVDLWAVRVDSTGTVQPGDYDIGSGSFDGQTLIARDFATPDRAKGEWLTLDASEQAALGDFLQTKYQAGDFVALRMTANLTPTELAELPGGSRYNFNSAPVLTLELSSTTD